LATNEPPWNPFKYPKLNRLTSSSSNIPLLLFVSRLNRPHSVAPYPKAPPHKQPHLRRASCLLGPTGVIFRPCGHDFISEERLLGTRFSEPNDPVPRLLKLSRERQNARNSCLLQDVALVKNTTIKACQMGLTHCPTALTSEATMDIADKNVDTSSTTISTPT
jgi:hypothetical protein